MRLYTNPASPFCRKVDVVLHETSQREDVTDVVAIGHPTASEQMPVDLNPMGKIPTLFVDEDTALFDSRVICRFLDARAGTTLCAPDRWDIQTLEAIGDGMCDAAVLMVYEVRSRPEDLQYAPWVEGQWAKVSRALDALEADWMELLQSSLNIGQISVACALSYLDLRHEDREWRKGRSRLAAWHAAFARRDAMEATVPHL